MSPPVSANETNPQMSANIAQMFHRAGIDNANAIGYRFRSGPGEPFISITLGEARERVVRLARALWARVGDLPAGTRVAIVCSTRLEWVLADYAALSLGWVTVPLYPSLRMEEMGYILQNADVRLAFVENAAQLEKVTRACAGFTFDGVRYDEGAINLAQACVVIDVHGLPPDDTWTSMADLLREPVDGVAESALATRLNAPARSDLATVVYTSGTTGVPKGVMLTHGNVLAMVEATAELGFYKDELSVSGAFCFLPLAHAFGRMLELGSPFYAATLILSAPETLLDDLVATRPGFVPAAPRVFEKIHGTILSGLQDAPWAKAKLFHWAMRHGERARIAAEKNTSLGVWDAANHALADRLVFAKIRERLGLDRCRVLLSGSAPLANEVQEFFGAIGLPIYEAYGMTEAIPGLSTNRPDAFRRGTVGQPMPGIEIRLAEDGELLARGPNISGGYLGLQQATAETFDAAGWLHTGDIGHLDDDGFVVITDRKKDLIKTSGGKYIAPQKVEGRLKVCPLIEDALIVGEGRKYTVALLVLDADEVRRVARRRGEDGSVSDEQLRALLEKAVANVNAQLASFETVKKFAILTERPSVANGLLTPSSKIRRREVERRFSHLIDAMYPPV